MTYTLARVGSSALMRRLVLLDDERPSFQAGELDHATQDTEHLCLYSFEDLVLPGAEKVPDPEAAVRERHDLRPRHVYRIPLDLMAAPLAILGTWPRARSPAR